MSDAADAQSAENLARTLVQRGVFAGARTEALEELLARLAPVRLAAGEVLFEQGDPGDGLYVVLEGELAALVDRGDASPLPVPLQGGDIVGEIQVITGGTRTATVRAVTAARLGHLRQEDAQDLAGRRPELMARIRDLARARLYRDQLVCTLPSILGPVAPELLADLADQVAWVHLDRGDCLFRQGDPGNSLFMLLGGRLVIVHRDDDGGECRLGELGVGEVVGEMAVFSGEPRSASVYAQRDSVLARLDKRDFETIVTRHPALMSGITASLVKRLRQRTVPGGDSRRVINVAIVPLSREPPVAGFPERLVRAFDPSDDADFLDAGRLRAMAGRDDAADAPDGSPYEVRLLTWLDQWESARRVAIYVTDVGITPWTRRCLRRADRVVFVGHGRDAPPDSEVMSWLDAAFDEHTSPTRGLMLLHPDGSRRPTGTKRWIDRFGVDRHLHIRMDTSRDLERAARFIAGRAVGLVMGGGGARGMAHIGVIRAMEDLGVPIDMIGGTSAGSIVAAQFAMGMDAREILAVNRHAFGHHQPFKGLTLPIISLVSPERARRMGVEVFGDLHLEDFWLGMFCVSCDISSCQPHVHRTGLARRAVIASCAIPGVSQPVVENGHLLVDGGVIDNLPVDTMRRLCSDRVIAVDVTPPLDLTVDCEDMPSARELVLDRLVRGRQGPDVPKLGEIILRSATAGSIRRLRIVGQDALLLLQPPVQNFALKDFDSIEPIAEVGYRYAMERLRAGLPDGMIPAQGVPAGETDAVGG